MLAFEILAEKIGFCGREDNFFWSAPIFVKKQDSVDVKAFFWFSPIFSGKQDSADAFGFLVT